MRIDKVTTRRGMSLLELMLALTVTALVAAAISGMMGALSAGVSSRRDGRSVMVRASAAESRLSAYVAPCRCILSADPTSLVLWLSDERESGTVHGAEVRWLLFDAGTGTLDVYYVKFPDGWAQAAKDLEDREHARDSNWMTVLNYYDSKTWIASFSLVDGLSSAAISTNHATALNARHVSMNLGFETETGMLETAVAATIRLHIPPEA